MIRKPIRAKTTEIVVFNGSEYKNDVQDFQEGVNSWLKTQPDNVVIEDIIYRYAGAATRAKDSFSIAIISRTASEKELNELD
jgi:hypothetical protein